MKPCDMTDKQLKLEVFRLGNLVTTMRRRYSRISGRVTAILGNQQHYLRHRAPVVAANGKKTVAAAKRLMRRMEHIPALQFRTTRKVRAGKKHLLFLCTNNEARKLRALARLDLRRFNKRGRSSRRFPAALYSRSRP